MTVSNKILIIMPSIFLLLMTLAVLNVDKDNQIALVVFYLVPIPSFILWVLTDSHSKQKVKSVE